MSSLLFLTMNMLLLLAATVVIDKLEMLGKHCRARSDPSQEFVAFFIFFEVSFGVFQLFLRKLFAIYNQNINIDLVMHMNKW